MTTKLLRNKDIVATAFGLLLKQEGVDKDGIPFTGGVNDNTPFRTTQHEAITAGEQFVRYDENGHKGYFEIATGIGKTAIFISLIRESYFESLRRGINNFNSVIVVPTKRLLAQTKDSFEQYAPSLKGNIGLYGDSHKDLSKPITIITYDSWRDLVEAGIMNYENTDLLISDEAHRGLSDRHVDNFFEAFGDETISFAFTATSEFDTEKTVEKTHGTKIYSKLLAAGVRGNELAAYIQTQLHEIGIETPDLTDEFNEEAQRFKQDPNYRAALKQKAWNRFALEQFKSGKDDHTGDFLHENKAAFFVSDTTHADDLETLLNEDMQLQFLAKSRGLKGVSVSIHSKLPPAEQKRRMKDYLAGKYLAVIGADQFKEGFDYPELKTVFDYPRGSLVDKSQILGRGGRKWWNEAKGRWEGMTFIDTVIYFDEPDPETSENNRERALRTAVLASSIIDGSHILSEAEEKKQKNNPKKPSGNDGFGPVYPEDLNVTSHVTLNQINAIHAKISHLNKEHWIELTNEMQEILRLEIDRTNLGSRRLEPKLDLLYGEGFINKGEINRWLFKLVKMVDGEKFSSVISFLKQQPNGDRKIELTDDVKNDFRVEIKRVGLTQEGIIKAINQHLDYELSERQIGIWLDRQVKYAYEDTFLDVFFFLKNLPTGPVKINISDKMRSQLQFEIGRTGLGPTRIANALNEIYGMDFIDFFKLRTWVTKLNNVNTMQWNAVIDFLQNQPDAEKTVELTKEMIEEMRSEMARAGLGAKSLSDRLNERYGNEYLSKRNIHLWMSGDLKKVEEVRFKSLISYLKECPTKDSKVILSNEMILDLKSEFLRTGNNAVQVADYLNKKYNHYYISAGQINTWLQSKVNSVQQQKYQDVLEFLSSQSDESKVAPKPPKGPSLG